MDAYDISQTAKRIAASLHRDMRSRRLARVDFDSVRCAVSGYVVGADDLATVRQVEDLENQTLRKFVEACA